MGLVKVYSCTKFEVSIVSPITNLRKEFWNLTFRPLDPDHVPFAGILSPLRCDFQIYLGTKFEISSFTPVPKRRCRCRAMAGCARGYAETNAWISVVFLSYPTKSGVNIVELSMFYANVLEFRFIFALQNYGANCLRLGEKMVQILGFNGPHLFQGQSVQSVSETAIWVVRAAHSDRSAAESCTAEALRKNRQAYSKGSIWD